MKFLSLTIAGVLSTAADAGVTSKLQVQIPKSLQKADGYEHRDAMFGIPPYGGSIQGQVYYADSTLCERPVDSTRGFPTRDGNKPWPSPFILLVDRGECTFVKKVRNAQRAGATAVLVADVLCQCDHDVCEVNEDKGELCESEEPIMADDGSGADISIPSFLLFKEDADPIKEELKKNNHVLVQMSFSVPASDSRVEYDLWTSPSDPVSRDILMNFKSAALALAEHAKFTPHQYVYDGVRAGCQGLDGMNQCYNLCTNNGQYCSTDPDDDLDSGASGADVVKEALRRICIWQEYGSGDGIGLEWWNYAEEFMFRCDPPRQRNEPTFFNSEECVADAMHHAGVDKQRIDNCMAKSGGVDNSTSNPLLNSELRDQDTSGVVLIPSLFVNQAIIRGSLSFVTAFKAICSGYGSGSAAKPDICDVCSTCEDLENCVRARVCKASGGDGVGVGGGDSGVTSHTFAGSLLLVICFFVIAGVWHVKRTKERMRSEVREILGDYVTLRNEEEQTGTLGCTGDIRLNFAITSAQLQR